MDASDPSVLIERVAMRACSRHAQEREDDRALTREADLRENHRYSGSCRECAMRIPAVLLVLWCCGSALAHEPPAAAVFENLKSLAGRYQSADPSDPTSVEMKTIANGNTLVETWTMAPTRQSMTVYTMDGDRLLATHYCPQGNAPRLKYARSDASGAHHFEFLDGANLQDPAGSHEHVFWIRREADGTITRSETYVSNNARYDPAKDTGNVVSFVPAK